MDQKAAGLDGYSFVNGARGMFYNRRPAQNGCGWGRPEPIDHSRHFVFSPDFRMADGRHNQDLYIWDGIEGGQTSSPSDMPNMADTSPGPLPSGRRWPNDMSPVSGLNPPNSNNQVPISQPSLWASRSGLKDSHSPMSPMDSLLRSTQAAKDNPTEDVSYFVGGMGRPVSVPSSMYPSQPITAASRHENLLHAHQGMNSTPVPHLGLPNSGPSPLVVPQPKKKKVPTATLR